MDKGSIRNVQGRFITAKDKTIMTKNNIVVKSFDKSNYDHSNRFSGLYMLILELLGDSDVLEASRKTEESCSIS